METNIAGQKVYYVDYTWKELEALDRAAVKVVLPSGAVEEHGPHLTVASDAAAAEALTLRAARQVKDVIVMPCLWYSPSVDCSNYTGTISIDPIVFANYVVEILLSLYRHGFKKIVIANIHGGAKTPLDVAIREFHARLGTREKAYADDCFVHLHNLYAAVMPFLNSLAEGKDWGHACEMETSLDLYLYPERVKMDRAVEEYIPWDKGFEWYIGDMRSVDKSGVHGDPKKASAEKGKKIADAIVAALADVLERM